MGNTNLLFSCPHFNELLIKIRALINNRVQINTKQSPFFNADNNCYVRFQSEEVKPL
jgi:hypothetical protein